MRQSGRRSDSVSDSELMALVRAIVKGDARDASHRLTASPALARLKADVGAARQTATSYFFKEIAHYLYAGDTALHMAAAAYQHAIARELIAQGADIAAKNRRGAEPLHYAADGGPGSPSWNPDAQAITITSLIEAGADANAYDKSGVAPLHRAVRGRCAAAVKALLAHGAEPRLKNKSGSTPLHLAAQNTGRGGTGSPESQEQQRTIIRLLLQHRADPRELDAAKKTAAQRAAHDWIRELLEGA